MTYQALGVIADAYIPMLIIATLLDLSTNTKERDLSAQKRMALWLLSSIALVYLIRYVDQILGLWEILNSDYSTHTAFALVFVLYWATKKDMASYIAGTSLILYLLLMWYQQYHSILDMVLTGVAVTIVSVLTYKRYSLSNLR